MTEITLEATISADGMLHVEIPGALPGSEVDVSVTPKLQPNLENGWPANFHERMFGCISDDTFVRHPQPTVELDCSNEA